MVNRPKSKKEQKKAAGLAQHRELQKAKDTKKKERKKGALPSKGKK